MFYISDHKKILLDYYGNCGIALTLFLNLPVRSVKTFGDNGGPLLGPVGII